jgi:fructose-bisphosphate aldolase, class I
VHHSGNNASAYARNLRTDQFLSGGLSEVNATVYLNAINQFPGKKPWSLTFSFGRALQSTVLKTWQGSDANVVAAQAALVKRARANGLANLGKYDGEGDGAAASSGDSSLFERNYVY